MGKYKVQIKVTDDVRCKLKILAEMERKTFQDFVEGVLTSMVEDIDIQLSTKPNDQQEEMNHE